MFKKFFDFFQNFFQRKEEPRKPMMYILVRQDLALVYKCVQGGHALAQYALEHSEQFKEWNNQYLIFLGVRNLAELRIWNSKLNMSRLVYSSFKEPDLDGHITAIAYYGTGEIFKDLKLA